MFSLSYNVFLNHNTLFLLATLSTQFLISCSLIRFVWSRVNSTKISSDIHEVLIDPEGRHGSKQNVENSITKAPLIGIIISVVLLQVLSGFLNLLSSLLYKNQSIGTGAYCSMVLTAYALSVIVKTIFTYDRIKNRKIKESNNHRISLITASLYEEKKTNPNNKEVDDEKDINLDFNTKNKIDLGFDFFADTIIRAGEIVTNFLYGSSQISVLVHIGITFLLQSLNFFLLIYSTYDRFSGLKLAEKDNVYLNKIVKDADAQEYIKCSITDEEEKKNQIKDAKKNIGILNLPAMMSVFVISQIVATVGKITVPILYQQKKISSISYFGLTFTTILFSSVVMLMFSVNRECDKDFTQHNLTLVEILEFKENKKNNNQYLK